MTANQAASGRTLQMPRWQRNAEGEVRRVGVELEMNGLTLEYLARLAADHLGLAVDYRGRYERALTGDPAGEWGVELDFALLKKMGRERRDKDTFAGELGDSAEEILKWLAETVVPLELVGPPLPLDRLHEIESLIELLRAEGAKGTSDRWLNAFGMQFNPEVPSQDPDIIVAYLKAFACLFDWLWERSDINLSRQVTNYIDPFPKPYVRLLLAADYWPGQDQLIDDYLKYNPTRNRALDMLPLFAYLDEGRVRRAVDSPLIKPRPTFHYRLPDCEIHRPGWGLYLAWNDWIIVEALASDRERLNACCRDYLQFLSDPIERVFGDWLKRLEAKWLDP